MHGTIINVSRMMDKDNENHKNVGLPIHFDVIGSLMKACRIVGFLMLVFFSMSR